MWLVGVVSRRWVWLGGIYGYGYCIGVASRCCCIYRYPHNNYPTPLVLGLFLAAASLLLCSCFFGLVSVILLQYIAVTHRTEIVKKSRSRETITSNVRRRRARASPETSTCEVRNQVRMTFD